MTTITAAPDTDAGTITLTIVHDTPVTDLYRADANGTRPVRLPPGTLPTATSGTLTVTDHEAALTGHIEYRAGNALVFTNLDGAVRPRFTLPSTPVYAVQVETVTAYSAARTSTATVHQVINRPDPLVKLGRLRPRNGSLDIICRTYAEARTLEAVFERGAIVLYRQIEHQGMDMYFHGSDVTLTPVAGRWRVSVVYVEVTFPDGDIQTPAGWTFDALTAAGGSFNDVAQDYRSFTDLALGEKI
jgi:hypothetical protein